MKVLILCTGNSCRSQMAEGFLKHYGKSSLRVFSAGTHPSGKNEVATKVMKESGIDIRDQESESIEKYIDLPFDLVITVCDAAKQECPRFPNSERQIHHSFPDPADAIGTEEAILDAYRSVRDAIQKFCQQLLKVEGKLSTLSNRR